MNHQDWTPVIFKKQQNNQVKHIESAKTISSTTGIAAYKIEKAENDGIALKYVSREDSQRIIQGRVNQKLTQQALAQQLNIQLKDIQEIENCKAIENKQMLSKIKKKLNV